MHGDAAEFAQPRSGVGSEPAAAVANGRHAPLVDPGSRGGEGRVGVPGAAATSAFAVSCAAAALGRGGGSRQCDELAKSAPESCAELVAWRPWPAVPSVLAE